MSAKKNIAGHRYGRLTAKIKECGMTSAKEQMIELRRLLGEVGFVDGVWQMRINAARPVPKPFTRGWKWSPAKVVALDAYRRKMENDAAQSGRGLG